jgi:hypothetical protein
MLKRVIHVLYGALMMVLGLVVAAFLISILFVVSQFGGNADFPVECAVVFGSAVHHKVIFDERKPPSLARAFDAEQRQLCTSSGRGVLND